MIDRNRFHWALALGFAAVVCFGSVALLSPRGVVALAGDSSSPGGRLYLQDMVVRGLSVEGGTIDGREISRLKVGNLRSASNFVYERDVDVSSIAPNVTDWTMQVTAPRVAASQGLNVGQTRACVDGFAVTRFSLLSGLLDSTLNGAIASGYNDSFIIALINLVGELALFDVTAAEYRSEALVIDAPQLAAFQGVEVRVTPKRTSAEFLGSCIS
jgi:hypothetical protein